MRTGIVMFLLLLTALCSNGAWAQQVESSLPLSQRMTINLAAGVPGYVSNAASGSNAPQSQWWFENTNNSTEYSSPDLVESSDTSANWQQVGLPYDANIPRTFINQTSGGGQGSLTGNENWYRLHFKVDPQYAGQKFLLNIEGAHTGVQVFINGTLLKGISAVAANAQATHVVGFIPVVVDLTPYLHTDGATDNVIAVDVSRGDPWFEQPGFSGAFRFGQAMAGLFRNVYLYVTNPVHIPINVYSNQKTWGTYVGTVSEVPAAEGTAIAASAVVEVQTNVLNETANAQQVTLTTQIVDAKGNVVVTAPPLSQSVPPMTAGNFPSTPQPMFQQLITVPNPTLWYPNNSIYGTPYMYKVYHIVSVNGVVVDSAQSPLGIRTITWDNNFPYFNGHAQYLWGGSGRYDYPALGSSVPEEQQWRDLAQIAAQGGNVWRPGHSTSSEELVEAADAYGIMIDQPSGDGEGAFTNPSADDTTLKEELHRDMIIRDRSHPSILDWEEDNGGNNPTLADALATLESQWDSIAPRKQATRSGVPSYAFINECDGAGCEVANKQSNPQYPAFGAEYWDNIGTGRGLAWDNELAFAAPYLNDWTNSRLANAFGIAQWYFADSPGEVSLYSEFQNQPQMVNFVRSLGYSSVDMNRFPRLLYYIYRANWVPYSIQPVVHLAHHWNRAYEYTPGTPIQENAFSNCPSVRLLINGVAKDPVTGAILSDQTPNAWDINSSADLTQNTTVMPGQVHWMVNWAPGTVTAECIDSNGNVVPGVTDTRTTAGPEYKIVLTAVPELAKPDGTSFQWTSNGSDAAFVTAAVEDAQGNLVPTAADNVTFSVSGPATYMGGSEQYVADPSWTNYYQDAFSEANSSVINGVPYAFFHSPGDPELNFEGGLTKIALRSTFTPGTVTVTATAPGLVSGSVQLTSVTPPAPVQSQAPAIIVPPINASVTSGFSATFNVAASGSGTLSYQWYLNGSQVPGATGTTYTTPATTMADNGDSITVVVSSGFGTVTSNPVTLTVSAPANVAITAQPASQAVVVGQSATLTVAATGSPQLNYQWFENGAQVASGPQNSYTTPVFTAPGTQSFYVVVSNPLNQVQSSTAVVTVSAAAPVSITTQPASEIVATNQPVQLTAVVAGSAPYTYQWQFTPSGGATTILLSNTQASNTISYTIPAMSAADVGAYTVTVNNAANVPVTSAAAQLTLAPPGVNLALDKPATSSSTQNACGDGTTAPPYSGVNCLGPENAVDGNLGTRWGSATAGAPPTPPVAGVDPSWLQVDLGSVQSFNTVIINWENAYATQYQILYTSQDPSTNPTWNVAYSNNAGVGGTETLNFPTVQGRYIRMLGIQRATQYGYSIYEFQAYNVAQCGGSTERYTVNASNPNLVFDNLLGLTWTRTIETDTAAGSQFTGISAASYCSGINMRIPTQSEALSISGNNNASCAFPGVWSTWTSTVNPNDASETAIVNFDGTSTWNVTNNYPGATLCDAGTSAAQPPAIQTQPQPTTVTVGDSATFTVAATGIPAPTYQWFENGTAIPGATAPTYITQPTADSDNGALFSVAVTNGSGTVTSNSAVLTVSDNTTGNNGGGNNGGGNGGGGNGGGASTAPVITIPPASQSVVAGATATFWVNLSGTSPLTYQWLENGVTIPGATSAVFTTPILAATDNGEQYSVIVNNTAGKVTSAAAVLTVSADAGSSAPVITTQPASQSAAIGATATFTVDFTGTAPFTYQWFKNGVAIPGATSGFFTTPVLAATDNGEGYSVTVGDADGTVASEVATLAVSAAGVNNTNSTDTAITGFGTGPVPAGSNLALGQPATSFGNENGGLGAPNAVDGDLTTRWSSSFVDPNWIQVDLGSVQSIGQVVLRWERAYGVVYQIQVSNDTVNWTTVYTQTNGAGGSENLVFPAISGRYIRMYGTQRSSQYGYSLWEFEVYGAVGAAAPPPPPQTAPSITTQPASQTVNVGETANFTVTASGTGPLTYQWLENGVAIPGATSASFTTPVLAATDNGELYSVTVTNSVSSVTSNAATLTVTAAAGNGNNGDTAIPGFGNGPVPAGPNLALNAVATSSGDESVAYPPSQATDGNLTTRWSSAFVDPSWIQIDLGSVQSIGQVVLRWERAYGVAYQIQVSTDAAKWTTVFTQSNGQGGSENLVFPSVTGRYVRMYGTQRSSQYGYSLWEFEVYGPVRPTIVTQPASQTVVAGSQAQFTVAAQGIGPLTYQWFSNGVAIAGATSATYTTPFLSSVDNGSVYSVVVSNADGSVTSANATLTIANPTPGNTNLALFKAATSSGNENDGLGPDLAVDGDLTTRWSSAFVDPSWIQIDLGSPLLINKVVLYWQNAYGTKYQIQVSNDEQNWTTVFTQANGQGGVETLTFPAVIDRYIRMYGTARNTQYGYSLYEFQVYGADLPSIVTQPVSQTVTAGGTVTFSVTAGGDGPFTYQWSRNGVVIPGATGTSYTTGVVTSVDNGSVFTVAVTNASGTTTSAQAVLTVNSAAPTGPDLALNQPTTDSGSQNEATLGSAFAVDGNLTTRWSSAFVDPSWIQVDLGAPTTIGQVVLHWENAYGSRYQIQVSNDGQNWTTAFNQAAGKGGVENLTFPSVTGRYVRMYGIARATQYGYSLYEFQIYAPAGSTISPTAPSITTEPANQTANVGSTATFTVVAGGTAPFTYQWLKNGVAIPGAASASYTTPVLAATDNGEQYSVIVTNAVTSVTSNVATLSVNAGTTSSLAISAQPTNQTATVGATATFSVTVSGTGPFTYQWLKNGVAIVGATSASYTTPVLAATDNGEEYSVTVSNTAGNTVSSNAAVLIVNAGNSGGYTIYPGFIGVDLNNNTNGVWTDDQIYVTVIGMDPNNNNTFAYLTPDGTTVDFTLNDSSAAGHLTGPNGQNYGNYSFTLAQSTLLKIPTFISARAYISLGAPLYIQVNGDGNGNVTGYAGPNPQNPTDPNISTHYDWYEFNNNNGIFINTTQVDQFGLPLLLDVWGAGGTFHKQVGITESIAQLDSEFASEVPAQFQPPTAISNLRILSPAKYSMAAGGANAHYFDSYIASAWSGYGTTPLSITLNGRQFTGTSSGSTLTFSEVNPVAANAGETFVVQEPSTQDVLGCSGTMASGVTGTAPQLQDENAVQLQLENQICSAINRGVLLTPTNWANASTYYAAAPANFYSQFWHNHSVGGLAYGFSYDDNNNQSTTITTPQPEHMAWGIGW